MENPWLPYTYQYIVGGLLFFTGLIVSLKKGAFNLKRQEDRWTLKILLIGFASYALVHAAWILWAV
jgi:hypothetical protein